MTKTSTLFLFLLLLGCHTTTVQKTAREDAVVVGLHYVPAQHGSSSSMSFSGKPSFGSVNIPAAYGVAFESPARGKFTIEGDAAERLWRQFHVGDHVVVSWEETHEIDDRTGADTLIRSVLADAAKKP